MAEATAGSVGEGSPPALTAAQSALWWMARAEIDTSVPFESVKEAVSHFGGSAPWRPTQPRQQSSPGVEGGKYLLQEPCFGEIDIAKIKEQTAKLEQDLIVKERETLDVLKELEMTKRIVDGLKAKIQNETSEAYKIPENGSDSTMVFAIPETDQKYSKILVHHLNRVDQSTGSKPCPDLILMKLKQAKVNLTRTTSDLSSIRGSVEMLGNQIERERTALDETRNRLSSNSAKITSLEKELHQTKLMLQLTENSGNAASAYPPDISVELHKLSSEIEQYKRMAEAGNSEVIRIGLEIEQTKESLRTAEIKWLAAKKMGKAAKAAEVIALSEIKALATSTDRPTEQENTLDVTLLVEEYETLSKKALHAEELSTERIKSAMVQVEEANRSKLDLLQKVEEATAELKTSRKALAEALRRVEEANQGKLSMEEALRKWRSEHGHRRRSVHNTTKFKTSGPGHHRKDSRVLDLNGISLVTDGSKAVLRPTLSIGQILSRKLSGSPEFESLARDSMHGNPKVSLGQMLSRKLGPLSPQRSEDRGSNRKQLPMRKKRFGFVGLSYLLAKQNLKNKKKKQHAWVPK